MWRGRRDRQKFQKLIVLFRAKSKREWETRNEEARRLNAARKKAGGSLQKRIKERAKRASAAMKAALEDEPPVTEDPYFDAKAKAKLEAENAKQVEFQKKLAERAEAALQDKTKWSKQWDASGKPVWVNLVTKTRTFEMPQVIGGTWVPPTEQAGKAAAADGVAT